MSTTQEYGPGFILSAREAGDGELFNFTDDQWEFAASNVPKGARDFAGCGDEVTGAVRQFGCGGFAVELLCKGKSIGFAESEIAGAIIMRLTECGPAILSGTVLLAEPGELRIYLALYAETIEPGTGGEGTVSGEAEVFHVCRVEINALGGSVN